MQNSKPKLTRSQTAALTELEFFYEVQRSGVRSVAGVWTRPCPLIIAPSGAGKTFLVNALAEAEQIPVFSINLQNWIVRGAKHSSALTLEQIADFVRSNDAGIIFIDEVNKLNRNHTDSSAWTADLFSEVISFLDCDRRLDSMGFQGIRQRMKNDFFVIGAAAFQDEWRSGNDSKQEVGFNTKPPSAGSAISEYERAVRDQSLVPDELLFRFSDRLIVIEPPAAEEFGSRIDEIRKLLDLVPLTTEQRDTAITAAQVSGKMHRWLEGYVTDCLREVTDGLERGANLAENQSPNCTPTCVASTNTEPPSVNRSRGVESESRSALIDFYRMLPDLSTSATRAEFAVAEIWRTARKRKDEQGGDRAFAAICNATDRLRKLTGREKASLIGALGWLATRVFDIAAAEKDEVRADIAYDVRVVVEHVRVSLELLRGQIDVGQIEGRLTQSIADFVGNARLLEGIWGAVVSESRRAN